LKDDKLYLSNKLIIIMSLIVETDIREILEKMDRKFDTFIEKVDRRFDAFEEKIDRRFDALEKDVNTIKLEMVELKGEFKVLESKFDGLSKRIDNQEFTSRSILASLIVVILGGLAKTFGILPANIA
jgi:predicted nuclease with TOPRIM domain